MAQRKLIFVNSDGNYQEHNAAADEISFLSVTAGTGGINTSGNIVMNNKNITGLADPINDQDAVNKRFLLSSLDGLDVKNSVRVATTDDSLETDMNLASPPASIDGVVLVTGMRVLVKNQDTNPEENGIYEVDSVGSLVRASDADTVIEFNANAFTFVEDGNTHADTGWVVTSDIGTLDTDPVVWGQFSGAGTVTASFGVEKVGTDIRLDLLGGSGGSGGLSITGNEVGVNFAVAPFNQTDRPIEAADLASTATGFGASILGVEDAGAYFTGTNVESVLQELGLTVGLLDDEIMRFTTDGTGVDKGDLVYFSANNIISTMPINALHRPIGVAAETVGASTLCLVIRKGVLTGVVSTATAGTRYYWDGSAWTTTIPSTSGYYVWTIGISKNASDAIVDVEFIKKNA
jgi:hypothetical protein